MAIYVALSLPIYFTIAALPIFSLPSGLDC